MLLKMKTQIKLTYIAHIGIAFILGDLISSIISRLLLFVCIGVLIGIQANCIKKCHAEKTVEMNETKENKID